MGADYVFKQDTDTLVWWTTFVRLLPPPDDPAKALFVLRRHSKQGNATKLGTYVKEMDTPGGLVFQGALFGVSQQVLLLIDSLAADAGSSGRRREPGGGDQREACDAHRRACIEPAKGL